MVIQPKKGPKLDQNLGGKLSADAVIHCLLKKRTKDWQIKNAIAIMAGFLFQDPK